MPAELMRIFGKSTKQQLTIIGMILLVLGAIGAFGVMFLSNETPVSLISTPAKAEFYGGVSVWAIFAFSLVAMGGMLILGIAFTGLPFVYMARYHMGVFYTSVFSLIIIPAALGLRMGTTLRANANADTYFAKDLTGEVYSSSAGFLAIAIGAVLLGICLFVIIINLLHLAKVSYRPGMVTAATVAGIILVTMAVAAYAYSPMMTAVDFKHELGLQGAVGFEEFEPQDVQMPAGWIKWLSAGEYSSTYGSLSSSLSIMALFLFLAIILGVVGFLGMALYSANDRKPAAFNLTITPVATVAFSLLAIIAYMLYSGALADMAERLNVNSEITKLSYLPGNMNIAMIMSVVVLGAGAFYTVTLKDWFKKLGTGKSLTDPLSMVSLVDPPTDLPSPPTGWPARWDRMSTPNYVVVGVAGLLVLSGLIGGIYVKGAEQTSSDFNPSPRDEEILMNDLPDTEVSIPFPEEYINEGSTKNLIWQADGAWFIYNMELIVTWTDESPYPRHTNLPDTFEGTIIASNNESVVSQGSSSTSTLAGEMRISIDFDQYILTNSITGYIMPPDVVEGSVSVNITCVEAQDQVPMGAGLLTFNDDGNTMSATLIVRYKHLPQN